MGRVTKLIILNPMPFTSIESFCLQHRIYMLNVNFISRSLTTTDQFNLEKKIRFKYKKKNQDLNKNAYRWDYMVVIMKESLILTLNMAMSLWF